jgi:carbon monoxide dehydrogenase subunit G
MELTATYTFRAPLETTWTLLMDTGAIANCLPGCRGLQPIGNDRYQVELGVAVAAFAGDFTGTVALEDKVPPHSYRLVLDGTGRQGFVKGQSRITLSSEEDGTAVRVDAQADVGGIIARVGQRLLEGVARTMMDRFFACLAKQAEQSR